MPNVEALRRMWNRLFDSLVGNVERRIVDVDSWDGSASRWVDTDAYCADCLIDVNAAAGRDEKAQSHCKLPVRGPDDDADTYVRQAVHAAAGGRGISRVTKPDDVPQEAWDAAVKAAANKIIAAYGEMDETAPDSVYEAAGKKQAERAMSFERMLEQAFEALNPPDVAPDDWAWPVNIYAEDAGLFVVVAQGGRLYRMDLLMQGETIMLGERVQVSEAFPVVNGHRGAFTVRRQADGRHRWLMIAATAVLNRVGEIDSTALLDSFIARAQESRSYPRLDFYHLGGENQSAWEFGQADYLAREGVCYVASGLFDEGHPLARATIAAVQRNPGRWGASIEYMATVEPEQIVADPDIRIPVYRDGVNTRISVVLENEAAGWYTTMGISQEVNRMRDDIMQKLRELFGGDEAALAEFAKGVDGVNRTVMEEGLIMRTQEQESQDEQPTIETSPPESEAELELDDETLEAIVQQVAQSETVRTLVEKNVALTARLAELTKLVTTVSEQTGQSVQSLMAQAEAASKRLAALERDDDEKQREWAQDLPAARAIRVTHRPRIEQSEDEDGVSYADEAGRTLAKIPQAY